MPILPTPAIIIFITNLPIRKILINLPYIIAKSFSFGNQVAAKRPCNPGENPIKSKEKEGIP
jgi:hypothetical protein